MTYLFSDEGRLALRSLTNRYVGTLRETMLLNPQENKNGRRGGVVLWLLYIASIVRLYFSAL